MKTILAAGIAALAIPASAKTELQWWHAMGGRLREVVDEIAKNYNASQSEYEIIQTYKGGYEDTMTAGIAAFRAK
jgi:sn-glycerol 3-phosphate transport system substrate-binding protein